MMWVVLLGVVAGLDLRADRARIVQLERKVQEISDRTG